ncbi:MAG: regulatory protein RecX [Parachlamydiaceae bacterium]|nr:regulatory protein RecX [Parachlamydiaceae bacterium]
MKVTLGVLDFYKKNFPLFIDEELWRTVHISIFGKNPSFPDVPVEELEERFTRLEYKGAKAFLIRRLALKNYHSEELKKALKQREVTSETIDMLLGEFKTQGYLNDLAWLFSFIRTLRLQGFGFKAIILKLRMKGVSEEISQDAIESVKGDEDEENDERASIKKLINTRYRSRQLSEKKERDKVIGSLFRKGYQLDDIFAVIKSEF